MAAHAGHPKSSGRARTAGRPHRRATDRDGRRSRPLILFYVGAIITHPRVRDYSPQFGMALGFLLLNAAALVLVLTSAKRVFGLVLSDDLLAVAEPA